MKYGPNREIIVDAGTGGCYSFIHLWVMFFLVFGPSVWTGVCSRPQVRPMTADEVLAADWSARFSPAPPTSGGESPSDSGHNTVIYIRRRWKELDGTLTSLNHNTVPFFPFIIIINFGMCGSLYLFIYFSHQRLSKTLEKNVQVVERFQKF